nr:MAG TPA: Sas10/Utp3/C1D family [Caudoviricetes sp.]
MSVYQRCRVDGRNHEIMDELAQSRNQMCGWPTLRPP